MTIKDVEERTGLSRSNIRFYEKEKLIESSRNESNGCVTCSSSSRLHPHFSPCVSISIILSLFESDIALQIFATSSLVTLSPLYIDINLSVVLYYI